MSQKPLEKIDDLSSLRIIVALLRAENDELREIIRKRDALETKMDTQVDLVESEI